MHSAVCMVCVCVHESRQIIELLPGGDDEMSHFGGEGQFQWTLNLHGVCSAGLGLKVFLFELLHYRLRINGTISYYGTPLLTRHPIITCTCPASRVIAF